MQGCRLSPPPWVLNRVNFAQRSTPQQATCQVEGRRPLPPLSSVDPRSLQREPCHECDSLMTDGMDRLHGMFPLQL